MVAKVGCEWQVIDIKAAAVIAKIEGLRSSDIIGGNTEANIVIAVNRKNHIIEYYDPLCSNQRMIKRRKDLTTAKIKSNLNLIPYLILIPTKLHNPVHQYQLMTS